MFYSLTQKDKDQIEAIYQHYLKSFPNIPKDTLHDRIFCGYCWGEGGFRLMYIEDWERVFKQDKMAGLFSVFKNWDEYFKYQGDYHNVL